VKRKKGGLTCFLCVSFFFPFSRVRLDDAGVCEAEEKAD
jgi:hypothetical protein